MSTNELQSPSNWRANHFNLRRFLTPRAIVTAVVVAVALGAGATAAVTHVPATEAELEGVELAVQPVQTIRLQLTDGVEQARIYTGMIASRQSADLGFSRAARLTEIHFDEGDVVQAGQPIAALDIRRLESKRRETVARHQAAVAQLSELTAGPRKETIAAARAQVDDLKSQLELGERTFRRTEKLFQQSAATEADIDNSRLTLKSAEARLNVAQKQLDELEAGTRAEQIAAQQAQVQQLVAALSDIDIELDESVLKAPFAGRIAARYVDHGTVVSAGQKVVRIVEHQSLEARIGLPLEMAQSIPIGDCLELTAGQFKCMGTLVRKLPEIDMATRTQTVIIEIHPQHSQQLVPGQVIQAAITQQVDQQGFLLPTAALLPGVRGLWSLFAVVEKDGSSVIERRHVEILHTTGDQVLIRGTLAPNDQIVISGVQRLVSGQRVEVVH